MSVTYVTIPDTAIDAGSPGTVNLFSYLRDNPIASHKHARRSTDHDVTNSSTLEDDDTLQFAAAANQAYLVKAQLYFYVDWSPAGLKTSISGPSGSTFSVHHSIYNRSDGKTSEVLDSEYASTSTNDDPIEMNPATIGYLTADVYAVVVVGSTAGTIKVRIAQQTAVAGKTTTLKAGSFLCYHRVNDI